MSTKKILDARGKTHGDFVNNAAISQAIKNLVDNARKETNTYLSPSMLEALDMIALKISRITTGRSTVKDHWVDIAGYATLVANTLED